MRYQQQQWQQQQWQQQQWAIQHCPHMPRRSVNASDATWRRLANRNEIRVSGFDSYALLFLLTSRP